MKDHVLVCVVWHDATAAHNWDSLEKKVDECEHMTKCYTVGYITHATKGGLYVTQSIGDAYEVNIHCTMRIPWGMVKSITRLDKGKRLPGATFRATVQEYYRDKHKT